MATHSSTLAWRIPWIEEPDGLQSMVSQRVRHDWVTKHTHICTPNSQGNKGWGWNINISPSGEKESSEWVPSYLSCMGYTLEAEPWLGDQEIGISKGIRGTWLLLAALSRKPTSTTAHDPPTGLQVPATPWVQSPHLPDSAAFLCRSNSKLW